MVFGSAPNLLVASAFVIRLLIDYCKQSVLDDSVVGTDDTSVTLLLPKDIPKPDEGDPKSRRIHDVYQGGGQRQAERFGPNVGLSGRDRAAERFRFHGQLAPRRPGGVLCLRKLLRVRQVVLDGPMWSEMEPRKKTFSGKLMADCYSGYQAIALRSGGSIQRGACVAHARRKVFDAREVYPLESSVVLAKFQQSL